MSNIISPADDHARPEMLGLVRRSAMIGALAAVALLGRASSAEAAPPPQAYCMPELQRLSAEWNAIDFGTPQKPSQQIVYSRLGLISSGPEVIFMRHQIRWAFLDCQRGNVAAARARAALVAEKLSELW
jgi:hypothetical protein